MGGTVDWDDVLHGDLEKEARAALTEMVASGAISFPRCVLGELYKEKGWMLMGFWDGGKPASACCLYARTPLREKGPEGETHLVRLLAGKARVTPTSSAQGRTRTSTPRVEMRGLLMLTRLIDELLPGIQVPPSEIMLMGDSQCTIACVEADNRVLDIWFSNRVAEVRDRMESWRRKNIKVNPLHHWPGESNIADLGTKGRAEAQDVIQGSAWQDGPEPTRYPVEEWPISRDFVRVIPEEGKRTSGYANLHSLSLLGEQQDEDLTPNAHQKVPVMAF